MIDLKNELNPAQYEAASTLDGPVLVIAGAGSGKTRTIVYRLANMVQSGIPASSILLLTFTRKASQEMLNRAKLLLGQQGMASLAEYQGLASVQGGTFHSFAYSVLRIFRPQGYDRSVTVMDSSDALSIMQHSRDNLKAGKGDRSFPRNQSIMGLFSKSRNKEMGLDDVIRQDSSHLLPHADDIRSMCIEYTRLKHERSLLDYDDILFEFEKVLRTQVDALNFCRRRHKYIMVDEYQDTNLVQARITSLLAGNGVILSDMEKLARDGHPEATFIEPGAGNLMVVGDDAQSIYAFRGANINNILRFPKHFSNTKVITLEQNYRSTQPLLDLSNTVLANASSGFKKHLFSDRKSADRPQVLRPMSDLSQSGLAAAKIVELLRIYPPEEIAVLFRAGYQSYNIEIQLNKLGIKFRKYGGIRYTDAAHIKDAMCFIRLVMNPLDFTAFQRVTSFIPGIGPKTSLKLHQAMQSGDQVTINKSCKKHPELLKHLEFLNSLRSIPPSPSVLLERVLLHYQPILETTYPDDYPRRRQGLDELLQISVGYTDLDLFIADLSLEDPLAEEDKDPHVTLSTIHSSKGLEWSAVVILDLVEDRFPSKHALLREEDFEEERRLMYVACTRAKDYLGLMVPATLYDRAMHGNVPATPSPFIRELSPKLYEELQEGFTGGWVKKPAVNLQPYRKPSTISPTKANNIDGKWVENVSSKEKKHEEKPLVQDTVQPTNFIEENLQEENEPDVNSLAPEHCGFCTHKSFGRGKIIKYTPPDKYQVNFLNFGVKTIMGAFLQIEKPQ